jgi:hypothetical protein
VKRKLRVTLRDIEFITGGKLTVVNFPRQYLFVFLVKIGRNQERSVGSREGKMMGNKLFD